MQKEPSVSLHFNFNGMLRQAFERLEGSNILWHIVGRSSPRPAHFLSLSYYFAPDLVLTCLVGNLVWANSIKEVVVNYKSISSEI